VAKE
jgi:hypothetical protein